MKYTLAATSDAIKITLSGRLTFSEAPTFPAFLAELDRYKDKSAMDIFLGKLDFIDSTGMSLFVHIYDWTQAQSCKVTVHEASGNVSAAMERAAFQTLFDFK
jgi:anti-anti-sigma factor